MQKIYCIIVLILVVKFEGAAQKLMKIPAGLANAEATNVKLKGGFGGMKYEFGPYRLISNKAGWGSSSRTGTNQTFFSRLFTKEEQERIKEKGSFTFISGAGDTALVNIAVQTTLKYSDRSKGIIKSSRGQKEYEGGFAEYTAIIQINDSINEWKVSTTASEVSLGGWAKDGEFRGVLTNGTRKVELKPVMEYFDGKKDITGNMLGLILQENDEILAAVQFNGLPMKQHKNNFVWISPTQNDGMKFMLATACTVLMARAHQLTGSMEDAGPIR